MRCIKLLSITSLAAALCFNAQLLIAGTLTVDFSFKKKPPKVALVYLPEDKSNSNEAIVDQKDKQFTDYLTVGSPGTEISFKNSDTINHNIYANDKKLKASFDAGLAEPGSNIKQKMTWKDGSAVKISCKIHPKMRAWVMSLSSKHYEMATFTKKQKKGSLTIEGIPDSLSKIAIWIPGYDVVEIDLKKGGSEEVALTRKKKTRGSATLTRS